MKRLLERVMRFLAADDGPTAVEYAMMILLIFLACLSVVVAVGQSTATSFDDSNTRIEQAVGE